MKTLANFAIAILGGALLVTGVLYAAVANNVLNEDSDVG